MAYSSRQQHCLKAMGLVAWTQRCATQTDSAAIESRTLAVNSLTTEPASAQNVVDQQMDAFPADLAAQAQWLVMQPLLPFKYRGRMVQSAGPESASLLVVCLTSFDMAKDNSGSELQLPLSVEAAQLLDLMMRAIGVTRSALAQCAVSVHDLASSEAMPMTTDANGSTYHTHMQGLIAARPRAVLMFDPTERSAANEIDKERCLLPDTMTPLWRAPHPQLLLQTPTLKRQAWEALKGLQNDLKG